MTRTMQPPPGGQPTEAELTLDGGPPDRPRRRGLIALVVGALAAVLAAAVAVTALTTPSRTNTKVGQSGPAAEPAPEPTTTTTAAPAAAPAAQSAPVTAPSCAAASATPPGPRFGAAVAADATGLVVFGGRGADFQDVADTWSFGCGHWGTRGVTAHPPAALGAAAAFDAARATTVLLAADGTTWTWNGVAWSARQPAASPPKLHQPSAAYDDARGRVVVYGPAQSGGAPQTWLWDGATWASAGSATSPSASAAGLAFDSARRQAVLFGGMFSETKASDETWVFDGAKWARKLPSHAPPPGPAVSAYDPVRQRVVVLAADGGTWLWDGADWAKQAVAAGPERRVYSSMAWVPSMGRVVLFGGKVVRTTAQSTSGDEQVVNDLWAWDGGAWSKLG
jgi:hypothetical protein